MFCWKCGNQMPDAAAFCDKCGAKAGAVKNSGAANFAKDRHIKIIATAAILLAIIVTAAIGTIAIQATPANRVKRQMRLAQKYLNEVNYEQAVLAYKEAISIDPKCEQAYIAMADIFINMNEEEKAVAILEYAWANIQTGALFAKLGEARKQAAAAHKSAIGISPANVGDIIAFGRYEQDGNAGNGAEPIEWQVLDKQPDRMLVISRYALDCKEYNETQTNVTWETCTLRSWLNGDFYNTAFNSEEQKSVIKTMISNPDNAQFDTKGGNATIDSVFCLSTDEAKDYFGADETCDDGYTGNRARATSPTPYAISRGARTDTSILWQRGNCWWWLRSPGTFQKSAANVFPRGFVSASGECVDNRNGINTPVSVRPALWIAVS